MKLLLVFLALFIDYAQMRNLATVRKVLNVRPIPSAEAIECVVIGGWNVVTKKDEYKVGDLAIYCEIDSWIPHHLAPFLTKDREPKEYMSIKGERLRTVKLRGQLSQGLLLPVDLVSPCKEGDDVSDQLGIVKYEPPVSDILIGECLGVEFPSFIPKTDQERIQNLNEELLQWQNDNVEWEVTEKLDGSSMTVYVNGDDFGVCSRNLKLFETEKSMYWNLANQEKIIASIKDSKRNLALQGELIGESVQGNSYNIKCRQFVVFDIYDIDSQQYLSPLERQKFCELYKISHVPIISNSIQLNEANGMNSIEEILKSAEGKSVLNAKTEREGLVFKSLIPNYSFKAISNKFLLKTKG